MVLGHPWKGPIMLLFLDNFIYYKVVYTSIYMCISSFLVVVPWKTKF
jgi:hypothetical protein